jgi:hypothetical protein
MRALLLIWDPFSIEWLTGVSFVAWAGILLPIITSRHAVRSKQPCITCASKAVSSWERHLDHELGTNVQLMLRLRMCRALLPVPHTSSCVVSNCICMIPHFHNTSLLDNFTCLILSLLLITPTDNNLPKFCLVSVFDLMSCLYPKHFAPQIQMSTSVHDPEPVPFTNHPFNLLITTQKLFIWWMVHQVSSEITATIYALWGWIVVLKDHTLWHHLFEPLKQCLGGCQLHSNAEVEIAICECLQMQELDFYWDTVWNSYEDGTDASLFSWTVLWNIGGFSWWWFLFVAIS